MINSKFHKGHPHGCAADNATLYGVCLHVPEIVQRSPEAQESGGCWLVLVEEDCKLMCVMH
ncbi:hypothetical protein Lal_00018291 [Lupinus albus]|nr:hypothetical protein Lal_00018291 [Lupinus albus]